MDTVSYIRIADYHIYCINGYFYSFREEELIKFVNPAIIDDNSSLRYKIGMRNILYSIGLILAIMEDKEHSFVNSNGGKVREWWCHIMDKFKDEENESMKEASLFLKENGELIIDQVDGYRFQDSNTEDEDRIDFIKYHAMRTDKLMECVAFLILFKELL